MNTRLRNARAGATLVGTAALDGSNAVDMWGRRTIFSNIPLDAVQEMTVLTNAFWAQ